MGRTLWDVVIEQNTLPFDAEPPVNHDVSKHAPLSPMPTSARQLLYERYKARITPNPSLDRTLVSFQANKKRPVFNWFAYREGFSATLVQYLLTSLHPQPGRLLDPFAGAGSALFAASEMGWRTHGIEVLPVGVHAMQARIISARVDGDALGDAINSLERVDFEDYYDEAYALNHVAITRGAFPLAEERQLIGYIGYCQRMVKDEDVRALLLFAAFCILEEISFTRKDGQYLRWDERSGRSQGKRPFHKGQITPFREAVNAKLRQIVCDLGAGSRQASLFEQKREAARITTHPLTIQQGSSLFLLPTLEAESLDVVLTSPPYANRYDYTRTYALELVYLGYGEEQVKQLRQAMLSCTVENRDKRAQLQQYYTSLGRQQDFALIDTTFHQQEALQEVLGVLEKYRAQGKLNNANITRLIHNYFYEMCFVVFELARALKPEGIIALVNDNVRYAGEEVPVDLILSSFAESFHLSIRHIWTLGRGKGNSSQQMGSHGRTELRKCIYVWEKA